MNFYRAPLSGGAAKVRDPEPKVNELSRYVDEGNPNTDDKIEEAHGKEIEQSDPPPEIKDLNNDQKLAAGIRHAIEKEESVPVNERRGIEVRVEHGVAILKGSVASQQEKRTIGDKAVAYVGPGKVLNHLEVPPEEKASFEQ